MRNWSIVLIYYPKAPSFVPGVTRTATFGNVAVMAGQTSSNGTSRSYETEMYRQKERAAKGFDDDREFISNIKD